MVQFANPIVQKDMLEIHKRTAEWADFKNATVLITGAYGMLASYLTDFFIWLNEEKHQNIEIIIAVKDIKKASMRFGSYLDDPHMRIYTKSLNEPFVWEGKIDYIFHAAGIANPKLYASIPVEVAEPNVIGTYQLLQWAAKNPVKGFLLFSSGDIYGTVNHSADRITEEIMGYTDPIDIHSCYGESKRMAETLCMCFAKEYNVPTKIARITHTYSPYIDLSNDPRVFSFFVKCAFEGKPIQIMSDGTAERAFCYITDAVVGYLMILFRGEVSSAYNVGNSRQFLSIKELAACIAQLANPPVRVDILGKRNDGYLENKQNHNNCIVEEKLMALGWRPEVSCEEGFRRVMHALKAD